MRPRISIPLAALALLASGAVAPAQQAHDHAGHDHAGHDHGHGAAPAKLPAPAGGRLVVEASIYDACRVERGGKIEHTFIVKNTGTGPLHLDAKPG